MPIAHPSPDGGRFTPSALSSGSVSSHVPWEAKRGRLVLNGSREYAAIRVLSPSPSTSGGSWVKGEKGSCWVSHLAGRQHDWLASSNAQTSLFHAEQAPRCGTFAHVIYAENIG